MSLPHEFMPERLRSFASIEFDDVVDLAGLHMILPQHQDATFEILFGEFGLLPPVARLNIGKTPGLPDWATEQIQQSAGVFLDRYNWWNWAREVLGGHLDAYSALIEQPDEIAFARCTEYDHFAVEAYRFGGSFDGDFAKKFTELTTKLFRTVNLFDPEGGEMVDMCIVPAEGEVREALSRWGRTILIVSEGVFLDEPVSDLASFVRVNTLPNGYHNANRDVQPFVSFGTYTRPWGLRMPLGFNASMGS